LEKGEDLMNSMFISLLTPVEMGEDLFKNAMYVHFPLPTCGNG